MNLYKLFAIYLQRYETKVKLILNTSVTSKDSIIPVPTNDGILEDLATVTLTINPLLEAKIEGSKIVYYIHILGLDRMKTQHSFNYYVVSILLNEFSRLKLFNKDVFKKIMELLEIHIPKMTDNDFFNFLTKFVVNRRIPIEEMNPGIL